MPGAQQHRIDPAGPPTKKPLLTILPGNYAKPLAALSAEMVGNYALRIDWSDDHGSTWAPQVELGTVLPQPLVAATFESAVAVLSMS